VSEVLADEVELVRMGQQEAFGRDVPELMRRKRHAEDAA
jgi:hypothetical protein